MQNISEILKELGIEVPDDKAADLNKKVSENYKTVVEFNKKLDAAKQEADDAKAAQKVAEDAMKEFDGIDAKDIKQKIADYEQKVKDAEENAKKQIEARDFEDVMKAEMEKYHFTSAAAKSWAMAQIREKGLKLENGKILGLDDLMSALKERDTDAFADDSKQPPAKFTDKKSNDGGGKKFTNREELNKALRDIKNASDRQQLIKDNIDLFDE